MLGPFTWLDLILVAGVLIVGLVGYVKGFLGQIISFIGFFGAIILALLLCGPLAKLIKPLFSKMFESTNETLGNIVVTAVSFLIICLVVAIVVTILRKVFKGVNKIPIIGPINRILGVVLSIFVLYAVVSVIFGLIKLVPDEILDTIEAAGQIRNGIIAKGLYNANWIGDIIGSIVSNIFSSPT